MPGSMKSVLVGMLGCTVLSVSMALAEQPRHIATVAFIEKPWALALDITGYSIHINGVKPDGRRYFFATNAATSMTLSVTLEMVTGQATGPGCLAHLEHIAQTSAANISQGMTQYEVRHMPVIEYLGPAVRGGNVDQFHLFACAGKENVYADVHISKTGFKTGDESLLRDVLASLDIVAAAAASSLDHFRAGSAPYLQGKFGQAIPHYEQAIALEQANSTLDKALWRLLVHNLGLAYGITGDLQRAKTTLDYGLSQDPANSLFHYHLARTYAEMNDRDKAMQSLHAAFRNNRHRDWGEAIPDPRQDVSFRQFMLDPTFRNLTESLMQPAI
ncbi:MAG: tetratricopeptide repeat protein [Nitrospira defluvii]|nr:tetratricopeptide repeat protein [Nitrospira defluvii]